MNKRLFGTDGIRGMANVHPMTGDVAMAVGRALGHVLLNNKGMLAKSSLPVGFKPLESNRPVRRAKVVVGKDTRLSGYMLENALVAGICSMGVDALVIGPLPTPGVAFVTRSRRADAGVMISASHNSYHDNGIKIFGADGFKVPDTIEEEIERLVNADRASKLPTADLVGKAYRLDDAIGRYTVFLESHFPNDLDLQGLRIVVDSANGAGYRVAPMVFEELGAEVIRIGVAPNGLNINDKCGATYPAAASSAVIDYRADLGISLDGDADRCILTDENGDTVDGDQIIGLCAIELHKQGKLKGATVVTTPMSNVGLETTLEKHGIKMLRADVGDRYVVEAMRKGGFNLGGEQSGHIVFLDEETTGDGVFGGLKVLEVMRRTGKPLSELKKAITLFPQVLENVRVKKKEPFENYEGITKSIEAAKKTLKKRGRVFVRYSGTEPLARVMVEGEDQNQILSLTRDIVDEIKSALG